eukprot:GHUV01044050.1.p1 GENE.GHUV01044050.1~~GHUV01044050.1.p1  ORF type:complete len:167 (-),score=35.69 GHUV01044050.1:334-834(-)
MQPGYQCSSVGLWCAVNTNFQKRRFNLHVGSLLLASSWTVYHSHAPSWAYLLLAASIAVGSECSSHRHKHAVVIVLNPTRQTATAPAAVTPTGHQPEQPKGLWASFKQRVKALKRDLTALYYAIHHPDTPWYSKLLPWLVLAYALSPLDLIPDFIPVSDELDSQHS